MPAIGRQEPDPLKKYWWVILVVCALVGAWIYMPTTSGTGSDSVEISRTPAEQSLNSLDSVDNPQGAPGQARTSEGGGAGASRPLTSPDQSSSLYHAPGSAAGAPLTEDQVQALVEGLSVDSLAKAMQSVASGVRPPDHGWGDAQVRTGFSRPKAQFEQVGALRGGTGGEGSAASLVFRKPFGSGGDPGLDMKPGPGLQGAGRAASGIARQAAQNNQSLNALDRARKTSMDSLKGVDERAMGMGGRSFDASGGAGGAQGQLSQAAAAAGLNEGAGVPANLKANDPSMNQKKLEPPKIEAASQVKDDSNKEYMQQQILMMIMGAAISGILGPTFSGVGMALAGGLGLSPPSSGSMDVVKSP